MYNPKQNTVIKLTTFQLTNQQLFCKSNGRMFEICIVFHLQLHIKHLPFLQLIKVSIG